MASENKHMKNKDKSKSKNVVVRIIISLFVGVLVGIFTGGTHGLPLCFATGILSALMTYIIIHEEYEHPRRLNDILSENNKGIENQLEEVSERMKNILEYAAFYTENNVLEKGPLKLLREKEDGIMWIIAKFISKQLSKSFSNLKFEISGKEYSHFSEKLYPECRESIYLTSPFTPAEWFRQLYDNPDEVIKQINEGKGVEYVPSHIKSLITTNVEKKRLVILPSWLSLIYQEKMLDEFLKINEGIEDRFVTQKEFDKLFPDLANEEFNFSKYDYAIYDKKIILKWERPLAEMEECPLLLIDIENPQEGQKYRRIVEEVFKFSHGQYTSEKKIKERIAEEKQKLIDKIVNTHNLPHKLSYFGTGATAWKIISNDPEYNLGMRERRTLQKFLKETTGKIKSECNIIHIAPGDGVEIPLIVDSLGPRLIKHYALIDISPELLREAASFGARKYKDLNFSIHCLDITSDELSPITEKLKKQYASKNLIFLVGNGAILSDAQVLDHIKNSMKSKDKLLVTLEFYSEERENKILEQYKLPSVLNLFTSSLAIIGVNNLKHEHFEFSYNKESSMIEVYFLKKEWCDSNPGATGLITSLPNNFDKIKVFSSFRPTKDDLEQFLKNKGFNIEEFIQFDEEHCCGCLCSYKKDDNNV